MELRKDPDHNLGIIEDAEKFIRDATSRIQQQKGRLMEALPHRSLLGRHHSQLRGCGLCRRD